MKIGMNNILGLNKKNKINLTDTFLGNVNHEFRTPMNAIMGLCSLMIEKEFEREKQQELLQCIYDNGIKLLDDINNLIDYSLIKHQKIKPAYKKFHLNQFMSQIFNQYNHRLREKRKNNITLHMKKSLDDKNDYIESDHVIISKIISLLMDNALKYTEKGTVELGYDKIGKKELYFFIKDTGVGIPKEQKRLIFQAFRQGSEGTTRKYNGLGLGLTLARELVRILNGDITYRNIEPNGSLFYFTIPFNYINTNNKNTNKSIKYIKNKKILIADHNFKNYLYTRSILSQYPLEIIYSNEMDKIINFCSQKKNKPDIIFINSEAASIYLDHLIRNIKGTNNRIPVIIQINEKNDFTFLKKNTGCDDYILKPFDSYALLDKISKHISKS